MTDERSDNLLIFVAALQNSFVLAKSPTEARFRTVRASPIASYASTLSEIRAREPELDAPYRPFYHDLQEWMGLPGFTVTRAVHVQEGARRLVKVYFEHEFPGDDEPIVKAGWILFRADQCWAIEAFEVRTKGLPATVRLSTPKKDRQSENDAIHIDQGTVRYRGSHEGIPVLESVERKFIQAGKPQLTRTVRVTDIRFGAAAEETFDLASFDAAPPTERGNTVAAPAEDIFVRLTRWLVRAIWLCSAAVVLSILPPLVRRVVTRKGEIAIGATGQEM